MLQAKKEVKHMEPVRERILYYDEDSSSWRETDYVTDTEKDQEQEEEDDEAD